jgi:hypothetical protein
MIATSIVRNIFQGKNMGASYGLDSEKCCEIFNVLEHVWF